MLKVLQSKPEVTTADFPSSVKSDLSSLMLRLRKEGHVIENLGQRNRVYVYRYVWPKNGGDGE